MTIRANLTSTESPQQQLERIRELEGQNRGRRSGGQLFSEAFRSDLSDYEVQSPAPGTQATVTVQGKVLAQTTAGEFRLRRRGVRTNDTAALLKVIPGSSLNFDIALTLRHHDQQNFLMVQLIGVGTVDGTVQIGKIDGNVGSALTSWTAAVTLVGTRPYWLVGRMSRDSNVVRVEVYDQDPRVGPMQSLFAGMHTLIGGDTSKFGRSGAVGGVGLRGYHASSNDMTCDDHTVRTLSETF